MNELQLKTIQIANKVFSLLKVKEGQSEREISKQIKALLNKCGAKPAFRIIVASGKRSAKPHGFATNKKIKKGDFVVIDFGAVYNGYHSDITRTFMVGKPTARQKRIYGIVKEAQKRAIRAAREGKACSGIDRAAREYIEKQGFGRYFVHNTGHGIGRKVHQAPKLSKRNRNKLKAGMVITVEPGIYIRGWGGVRIEDMVLVTAKGGKVLTK